MEGITTALSNLVTISGTLISFVTENALLSIVLVAGLVVPAGFKLFKSAKHAAK